MAQQAQILQVLEPRTKSERLDGAKGCSMYEACPICYKCKVFAPHLYARCDGCAAAAGSGCTHTEKTRAWAIRRDNFSITVTKETAQALSAWMDGKL